MSTLTRDYHIKLQRSKESVLWKSPLHNMAIYSELPITNKCNLKCKLCTCNMKRIKKLNELSKNQYKKIIKKMAFEDKVSSINFTGGEPTLKPELLLELISYSKSLKLQVNLKSNGTLINHSLAKALKKAGLDSAQISIEGTTPNTHNLLTKKRGSFEKSIAAIGFLNVQNINTYSSTTLCKLNASECIEIPDFATNILDSEKFSINLLNFNADICNKELLINSSEMDEIIQKIKIESKNNNIEFIKNQHYPICS